MRFAPLSLPYNFSCLLWWMTCAPLRFAIYFLLFLPPQLRFAPLKEKSIITCLLI